MIYYKVSELIDKCSTLDDAWYIIEKIQTTPKINRRTIAGRKLTQELLSIADAKYRELSLIEAPF